MDRKARRKFIEQLVNDRKIETQDELLQLLTEAGVETTQATISRDIHALNIVKANDGKGHTMFSCTWLQSMTSTAFIRAFMIMFGRLRRCSS